VKDAETERLVAEMEALPEYRGWRFTYEYPGYFCYSHPDNSYSVFFTPDWEGDETLPIQVQVDDGRDCEEHSERLPLSREGRTGEKLFDLVRPTLDKLLGIVAVPSTIELRVRLTEAEISALKTAHEHVRVHMVHQHPWEIRDTAMGAIGKVLTAALDAQS
jgi:hypothetical protein